jgi:hypothetical protein
MSKRTPGRWYADSEKPDWKLTAIAVFVDIEREDPATIAEFNNTGDLEGQGEANAMFVLRAVNNHDALMDALETLLFWQNADPSETIAYEELLKARKRAHEAVAQAKGGSE